MSTKQWYVVRAATGKENRAKELLKDRIIQEGLGDKFGDILIPTETVVGMKAGKKYKSERKFFPGYLLVEMELDDYTWRLVRETNHISGFAGGKQQPAPLSEKELGRILQRVQEGADKPKPRVLFEAGEVIRVIDGPFADFNGVVEEVNYEKNRLKVAVLIFGRSTPVDLEFSQVEKE